MPRYREALRLLQQNLQPLYEPSEAAAISSEVLQFITGNTHASLLMKDDLLTPSEEQRLAGMTPALRTGRPMQYVLGEAWFLNRRFIVNESVLIPRPETEELVGWIIDDYRTRPQVLTVLDIGTGSGCIPISLKLSLDNASVASCDISKAAIGVAGANASALNAVLSFTAADFLDAAQQAAFGQYDIIVSNPPYIPQKEQSEMHHNITEYEPGIALFVPDDDPLLFYRAIATFGRTHLKPGGAIYCELHQDHAEATGSLFRMYEYTTLLRKDLNGHWRMLKAICNE